jgi:hypothetical protein
MLCGAHAEEALVFLSCAHASALPSHEQTLNLNPCLRMTLLGAADVAAGVAPAAAAAQGGTTYSMAIPVTRDGLEEDVELQLHDMAQVEWEGWHEERRLARGSQAAEAAATPAAEPTARPPPDAPAPVRPRAAPSASSPSAGAAASGASGGAPQTVATVFGRNWREAGLEDGQAVEEEGADDGHADRDSDGLAAGAALVDSGPSAAQEHGGVAQPPRKAELPGGSLSGEAGGEADAAGARSMAADALAQERMVPCAEAEMAAATAALSAAAEVAATAIALSGQAIQAFGAGTADTSD